MFEFLGTFFIMIDFFIWFLVCQVIFSWYFATLFGCKFNAYSQEAILNCSLTKIKFKRWTRNFCLCSPSGLNMKFNDWLGTRPLGFESCKLSSKNRWEFYQLLSKNKANNKCFMVKCTCKGLQKSKCELEVEHLNQSPRCCDTSKSTRCLKNWWDIL